MKRIVSCILALLILCFSMTSCDFVDQISDRIEYGNNKVVAWSDNFEITYSMMVYFSNAYYIHWYELNFYYIMMGDHNFDPSVPFSEQFTDDGETTYYEFFVNGIKETVMLYLKYCEAALSDESIDYEQLKAEAEDKAGSNMASINHSAYEQDVSLNTYIQSIYGDRVNKKHLYNALVIENLASSYYDIIVQRIKEENPQASDSEREQILQTWFNSLPYTVYISEDVFDIIFEED